MKRNNIVTYFILCFAFIHAQNENRKWYFGNKAGLDFMTSPPTVLANSASNSQFGCSSIADAAGNLLFYTDGMTVYNQIHSIMSNGTGLGTVTNTNNLSYQYSAIVKQPGSANIYYIFTNCCTSGGTNGIYCSTVDMNLAAGMGSVTIKNTVVSTVTPAGEMGTVKHCNGKDIWLMTHDFGNSNFRAFLITSSGINLLPVISAAGFNGAVSSYLKISRSGKKLATVYNSSCLTLYDFDPSTAVVSNSLALSTVSDGADYQGTEFSPDGTKLYCVVTPYQNHHVSQWDLCAGSSTAIAASQFTVAATNLQYGIQLAPDNKIYVARFGQTSLGVINNPNAAGSACNYVNAGQALGLGIGAYGLPGFVSTPPASPAYTYTLDCENVKFSNTAANCAMATNSLLSSFWDFGDPLTTTNNTSTAQNPTHQYSAAGTFTTKLILNYQCFSDTLVQIITISTASPTFAISGQTILCKGDAALLTASSAGTFTYNWSTGSTSNSIIVTPTANATYTVSGINNVTGCSWTGVISVAVNKCTSIANNRSVLNNVAVYPNPASHVLIIEFETSNGVSTMTGNKNKIEISITNQFGQIVCSKTPDSSPAEIDISTWAKGIYFVKILKGEEMGIKKLMVE